MKKLERDQRQSVVRFSILATLLVVVCHTDDYIPAQWKTHAVKWLGETFSDANVSNFFFLSGFLLAGRYHERHWWLSALVKRAKSLVVPYVIWNAMFWGVFALANLESARCNVFRAFGIGFNQLPIDLPLWYIKTLLYFVILSPMAFFFSEQSTRFGMACGVLLLFHCLGTRFIPGFAHALKYSFPLVGFTAFIAGGYCRIHELRLPCRLRQMSAVVPAVAWIVVSSTVYCIGKQPPELSTLNEISEVFFMVWIASSLSLNTDNEIVGRLASCTFFIYASHRFVLHVLLKTVRLPENSPDGIPCTTISMAFFFVLFLITTLICASTALSIQRISPRMASLLSGGRMKSKGAHNS